MSPSPCRLLVVDDNADHRADLRRMLLCGSETRYVFVEADCGVEAVRAIRAPAAAAFDCVLLDFFLPDMDALEVLGALGDAAGNLPCPIVVLTGADRRLGTRVVSAGAQDFLGKGTLTAESLTRAVENAIDRFKLFSSRSRVERDLLASEDRYRTLFESIDQGFCIIRLLQDEHGHTEDFEYLEVNPAFAKNTGIAQATGRRALQLMPNLEAQWLERYARVAETGEPERFVAQVADLEGRWFDVYAMRVDAPASRTVAVLFTDVSERKRIELALTTALATAETASRAKSDFLSNMSHELRSPLNAILGFAQLIESGAPAPTALQCDSLEQIIKAGWYLLELISEILDLAKIESGKPTITLETISLGDVLAECAAMFAPLARNSDIRFDVPAEDRSMLLRADRMRLKQVFLNLLSNSIKYNRAGGRVHIRCTRRGATRIRVSVEDTGHGLSPDQVAHLFEPFERLGQESGVKEGAGIGLVVSKRLVELMGGAIGAESKAGLGSTFWVEFDTAPPLPNVLPGGPRLPANDTVAPIRPTIARPLTGHDRQEERP